MSDRFLELVNPALTNGYRNRLFNRLNPCQRANGFNNCDAAAAVLFDYLATGEEQQAICIDPSDSIIVTPNTWTPTTLQAVMRLVLMGGHGTQVIVLGERNRDSRFSAHHVFNIMCIDFPDGIRRRGRGGVHAADAYANLVIPARPNPTFAQSLREIRSFYVDFNEIRRFKFRRSSYTVRIS